MEEISFLMMVSHAVRVLPSGSGLFSFFISIPGPIARGSGSPLLFSLKDSIGLAGIVVQTPKLPVLLLSQVFLWASLVRVVGWDRTGSRFLQSCVGALGKLHCELFPTEKKWEKG